MDMGSAWFFLLHNKEKHVGPKSAQAIRSVRSRQVVIILSKVKKKTLKAYNWDVSVNVTSLVLRSTLKSSAENFKSTLCKTHVWLLMQNNPPVESQLDKISASSENCLFKIWSYRNTGFTTSNLRVPQRLIRRLVNISRFEGWNSQTS